MSFQLDMQQTAKEIIAEFGTTCKFTVNSGDHTGTSFKALGVFVSAETVKALVDSHFVELAQKILIVEGKTKYILSEGDTVKMNKNTYQLANVVLYNTDDVDANTIVYILDVRP